MSKTKKTKSTKQKTGFLREFLTWENVGKFAIVGVAMNNYSIVKLLLDQEKSPEMILGAVTVGVTTFITIVAVLLKKNSK